jgi:hypothetical protein
LAATSMTRSLKSVEKARSRAALAAWLRFRTKKFKGIIGNFDCIDAQTLGRPSILIK